MYALAKRIDSLEAGGEANRDSVVELQDSITKGLRTFGVRVGVVTTEITAAVSLSEVGSGYARLTNQFDILDDTEEPSPVFNMSEDVYLVGSRICVFQFMDSYFVISDSGVDPVVVLPIAQIAPPLGTFYVEIVEGIAGSLIDVGAAGIIATDVEDVGGDYSLTIESIIGVITIDVGDSGLEYNIDALPPNTGTAGVRVSVMGTLAEIDAFFRGSTTGTLTITAEVPGTDTLFLTLVEADTSRTGSTSIGVLATAAAPAPSTVAVQDEGSPVVTATALNFIGAGVTATDGGSGVASVTIPGGSGVTTTETYAAGTVYTLTATPAAVVFGTTSPSALSQLDFGISRGALAQVRTTKTGG
jgi:hypothetical protein